MNSFSFVVHGRSALFTDPVTRGGGDKTTYPFPTYEALKGVAKSIYWKPTIIWVIDRVRVMNEVVTSSYAYKSRFVTEDKSDIMNCCCLSNVRYHVEAHFEFNEHRTREFGEDFCERKHSEITSRSLLRGGRRQPYLGTSDCFAYVEPCGFNDGTGFYDSESKDLGIMFHSFGYPDETGENILTARLWNAKMEKGVISFPHPSQNDSFFSRKLRDMKPKVFKEI